MLGNVSSTRGPPKPPSGTVRAPSPPNPQKFLLLPNHFGQLKKTMTGHKCGFHPAFKKANIINFGHA